MPWPARSPLRVGARFFGLSSLVVAAVVLGISQQPDAQSTLPACDKLDALYIPMQMNLRASAAMVACGRGGEVEAWEAGGERESLVGGNVDVITGAEVIAHPTQSEHQIWANGSTVVVNYNDSRTAPANYSGLSYSTDSGVTYTRLNPSPFASGHGTNFGDPTVVFSKAGNLWTASDLATGCGGQGIGMWTSANGSVWSTGACVHSGANDDRQSHAVDNNVSSPYYGRQYISWNNFDVGGGALQVVRSTDNGATWSAPVTAFASFIRNVQIQVAENGTVLVAAMNEGGGGLANRVNHMFRSTDGGATFGDVTMGAPFAPPGDRTSGYFAIVDPIWRHMGWGDLATAANNVVLYAYAGGGSGLHPGARVKGDRAAAVGSNPPDEPLGDSSFYQQIAVPASPGNLTFWYKTNTVDTITFDWQDAYITDTSGNILTTIFHVCQTAGWTQATFNMAPYANTNVRIKFLVHEDGFGDDTDMFVDDVALNGVPLTNGGFETGTLANWTIDGTSDTPTATNTDKHTGTYSAHLGPAIAAAVDHGNIYTTRSTDNGATWSAPVRQDGSGSNFSQWMPSAAGGGRNFMVSWYDRKNTGSYNYERYGIISRDGGVTWSQPRRISDMIIPQPAQPDGNVQPLYAGDYMRSFYDAPTQTFFDGWTDGRVAVSGTNQQDVETQKFRANAIYDRDGDAKTDFTLWRPSNGVWYSALSGGGAFITGWGVSTDKDVANDYDGDGKLDIGVWRPSSGTWLIVRSSDGGVLVDSWGVSGDIPVAGDVDGDGKADLGVFRPSAGVWFVKKSTGGSLVTGWGISGDVPMLRDFDGDGKDDLAIFRPSSGVWYILLSGGGSIIQGWGVASDIPVMGDWDGDGKADIGIFRPSSGTWLIIKSTGGTLVASWGMSGDVPVAGDWDGDGRSDFGVFRGSVGVWFVLYAGGGSTGVGWGINGDYATGRQPGTP